MVKIAMNEGLSLTFLYMCNMNSANCDNVDTFLLVRPVLLPEQHTGRLLLLVVLLLR